MIIGAFLYPKPPEPRIRDTAYEYVENGIILYKMYGFKGQEIYANIATKEYPYIKQVKLKEVG